MSDDEYDRLMKENDKRTEDAIRYTFYGAATAMLMILIIYELLAS